MPRMIVTDKLRSYGAAHREVMPSVEHRAHNSPNNRAENSHQPCPCRKPHPCRSRRMLIFVQDAAEAIVSVYVEVG